MLLPPIFSTDLVCQILSGWSFSPLSHEFVYYTCHDPALLGLLSIINTNTNSQSLEILINTLTKSSDFSRQLYAVGADLNRPSYDSGGMADSHPLLWRLLPGTKIRLSKSHNNPKTNVRQLYDDHETHGYWKYLAMGIPSVILPALDPSFQGSIHHMSYCSSPHPSNSSCHCHCFPFHYPSLPDLSQCQGGQSTSQNSPKSQQG